MRVLSRQDNQSEVGDQGIVKLHTNSILFSWILKVTVQFERCFLLIEYISDILCRNPINLYITEKLIKFSKSLFNLYLVISNKENERLISRPLFSLSGFPSRTCCVWWHQLLHFVFDTICSPKPCQAFFERPLSCILQPKPRNSTFGIKSSEVENFLKFQKPLWHKLN